MGATETDVAGARTGETADGRRTAVRGTIGIIAGSGPEAGIDLWSKVVRRNQALFGPLYRGDLDAPRVVIRSEPDLGLSMELARYEAFVWESLRQAAAAMAAAADIYAIACNTLNCFASRIEEMGLPSQFVSFQSVLGAYLARTKPAGVALLGAGPVVALGPWSPYRDLGLVAQIETPADPAALHELIYDVKRLGSADPSLRPRFARLVAGLRSQTVLLACTELPLIADIETDKTLVDVTELVAEVLVARSLRDGRA